MSAAIHHLAISHPEQMFLPKLQAVAQAQLFSSLNFARNALDRRGLEADAAGACGGSQIAKEGTSIKSSN
jgi:hypothetical protein